MKLVTFEHEQKQCVGVIEGNNVIHLNKVLEQPDLTMLSLVEKGRDYVREIEEKLQEVRKEPNKFGDDHVLQRSEVKLKAPLPRPKKVVCVGNNYMDHCREQNVEPPKKPLIFSKWSSCIIGPGEDVVLPAASEQVDYEAELGVVIGQGGKNIAKENAFDHVFGYVIVNDISARDVQFSDGQWVRGKSFDTFAPCGPYLVTADEVKDPQNLPIRLKLNGELVQDSNTREMIFSISDIISYLSTGFTFDPGDLIATGTPHGVGVFREPQLFLKSGDEMAIAIEGLGTLTNACVRETNL